MINDWECISTVDVGEGERLVAISWIDTGIKVTHSTLQYSTLHISICSLYNVSINYIEHFIVGKKKKLQAIFVFHLN